MNKVFSLVDMGAKTLSSTVVELGTGFPVYGATNFGTNVRSRYRKNELIYACVEKTGKSAAQISLEVKDRRTNDTLLDHPLQYVIEQPNPYMSEYDLWETILVIQMLAGRAVVEKERNNRGQVIGLWPLRPDWLDIVPDPEKIIAGFNYGPASNMKVFIPYEDTVDFPLINPTSPVVPFQTNSPVSMAARVGDTDNQITDFVKLFFEKGGVPPGLLKTRQKLIESQVGILRRRWGQRYGGIQNWLEPAILDSDAEYQRIGMTFNEMGFEILDRRNETRICMALDIPPIIVGAFVGLEKSTFDNYANARKAWWQDSLMPRFTRIRNRMRIQLAKEFGKKITLDWNLNGVFAFQQDVETRWKRAGDALVKGGITVNMYLKEIGYNPIGGTGDVFLRPLSYIEVPLKGSGQTIDTYIEGSEAEDTEEVDDPKLLPPIAVKAEAPPDRDIRNKLELRMRKAVKQGFNHTFERIKEELNDAQ